MSAKFECVGQILIAKHAITFSWENVALIETTCSKQGDLQRLQYFIASTALAIKIFLLWQKMPIQNSFSCIYVGKMLSAYLRLYLL